MKHKVSSKLLNLIKEEHKKLKRFSIGKSKLNKVERNVTPVNKNEIINDTQNLSCVTDTNKEECSKLTAQEFAKAVGINIFKDNNDSNHDINMEENNCSCEYCTETYSKSFCSSYDFTTKSNNSIINSKTIDVPCYDSCHGCCYKKQKSKITDLSLFINPSEQETKKRINNNSTKVYSRQRSVSSSTAPTNTLTIGNYQDYQAYCRQRSASISIVSMVNRNSLYSTSPVFQESILDSNSYNQGYRCDSGIELCSTNMNCSSNSNHSVIINHKKSSVDHTNFNAIPISQYYNQTNKQKNNQLNYPYIRKQSIQSDEHTLINHSRNTSVTTTFSNYSTQSKSHPKLKITKSITVNEGVRCAEINIKPIEKEEIKVYTKGRFTVTCKSPKKPSY